MMRTPLLLLCPLWSLVIPKVICMEGTTISLTSSPSSPIMAGDNVTLTCSVTLPTGVTGTPDFQWEGPGVTPTPGDPITSGQVVSSDLTLSEIATSQAGQYTCTANLNGSNSTSIIITVRIPSPEVMVSSSTESELVSGSSLSLTCSIQSHGDSSVDTATTVISSWNAPNSIYDRVNTANESSVGLVISSVQASDSGDYICSASVIDFSDSVYVVDSYPVTDVLNISIKLSVTVSANYTTASGDNPGQLGPNEFIAGSALSLNCIVQGSSSEGLNYTWSVMGNPDTTGCESCSIASSTTFTLTLGIPALTSYYAGVYTCTVSESGRPDSSSDNFTVAVLGAGIYIGKRTDISLADRHPIANNGLIMSGTDGLRLNCVSNSSQSGVGTIIGLDGNTLPISITNTDDTGVWRVNYPFHRPGVVRLQTTSLSSVTAANQGIYTCSIPDSNNNLIDVNVGLYPNRFTESPSITALTYQEESHTLTCVSTGSPATTVSWMKDGQPLTIDGSIYYLTQTITDRASSTYSNVLTVSEVAPSGVTGTYNCTVTNELGSDSSEVLAVGKKRAGDSLALSGGTTAAIAIVVVIIVVASFVLLMIVVGAVFRRNKKIKNEAQAGIPPVDIHIGCDENFENEITQMENVTEVQNMGNHIEEVRGDSMNTYHRPDRVQQLKFELSCKNMILSKNCIQISTIVGHGNSGVVYCGYLDYEGDKDIVAIKTCKALSLAIDKEKLLKEVTTMLSFNHPNVMSLIGVCFDGETPLLVLPYMFNGSVLGYVKEKRSELHYTKQAKQKVEAARTLSLDICYQITKGMQYLARCKFVHRDLAARNCMINQRGVIKIADFGLTEYMYASNYFRCDKSEVGSEEKVPIRWMAPESIENDIYNERTDVWAFGVTCWEVFTCGGVPYAGVPAMTLLSQLHNGHRLNRPSNATCSDEIWGMMTLCWTAHPQQRPVFTSLVNKLFDLLDHNSNYLKLN